jgi:uncharacterized protein (DUF58 family)
MRPAYKLLQLLAGWSLLALMVVLLRSGLSLSDANVALLDNLWWGVGSVSMLACLYDARRQQHLNTIEVKRKIPASLALDVSSTVQLEIRNPSPYPLRMTLYDHYPAAVEVRHLPVAVTLAAQTSKTLEYPLTPSRRGDAEFGPSYLRVCSPWGLWQRLVVVGKATPIRIYPNFAPIAHLATLGMEENINRLGIHLAQRRGEGLEFHQLREFRAGDALRQIDWKATARLHKPISREYQDERDQDVVFLLDCGRRLRAKDDALSHFDHALNALLLTAYVALRQGDAVGFMSFAGVQRWLSPVKGQTGIHTLLNRLYDVHSSTANSDFLQAAQHLINRHRKRSLVVMISNIREEDGEDLLAATRLLGKQHVVMVASLRENFLDQTLAQDVVNFNDALRYCGVVQFVQQRHLLLQRLRAAGVVMVDATPQRLHMNLVNEYLKMKRSGRL